MTVTLKTIIIFRAITEMHDLWESPISILSALGRLSLTKVSFQMKISLQIIMFFKKIGIIYSSILLEGMTV